MNQSNIVKDGAINGLVFLLLMLITIFFPIINFITVFLLPVPFVLMTRKYGWKAGAILFVIVGIISAFLLTYISVPLVLLVAIGGIAIGASIRAESSPYETWAAGAAGFAVGFGLLFLVTQFVFQVNWMDAINQGIEDSFSTSEEFIQTMQINFDEETLELAREQAKSLVSLIPTFMMIISIVMALLAQWVSYRWINRKEDTSYRFPKFRYLTFPTSLIWYYLVAIVLTWMNTDPSDTLYLAGVNLYAMIGLLLVVQGISFIVFYVHHKKWPKFIPFAIVAGLVLFPFLLLYPLRILGIIDLGFQLRSRLSNQGDQ
ncbi:YybS family protein [Allobacillus sp. GCM10007491]|uniref:YybS family protein n=1 Tax=Allobacillus saliphilus TaxID=2912308 RepID=A0A941HU19_9BACI|nr:YybS family protein [Allobacillus saliphilus]MBR7554497.1 YybS family protein [Allobacillus saliphilus]